MIGNFSPVADCNPGSKYLEIKGKSSPPTNLEDVFAGWQRPVFQLSSKSLNVEVLMITGFYAGLLGLVLVVLILQVVMRRWKFKVGLGDGGIPELEQRIRAHANFIETVPFLLILLYLIETAGYPDLLVHAFGIIIVLARVLHAVGLYMNKGTSIGRLTGTIMTCSLLIIGSLLLIYDFMFGDYVS